MTDRWVDLEPPEDGVAKQVNLRDGATRFHRAATGGESGEPERAQVPYHAPHEVRVAACVDVLRTHNPRPLIAASPGHRLYEAGLTARCVCGWEGTSQVASGLATETHRALAEREAERHLAEKILERLG